MSPATSFSSAPAILFSLTPAITALYVLQAHSLYEQKTHRQVLYPVKITINFFQIPKFPLSPNIASFKILHRLLFYLRFRVSLRIGHTECTLFSKWLYNWLRVVVDK